MPSRLDVLRGWWRIAIGVGVIVCVTAATIAAVVKLDDALGSYDASADRASSATYADRTLPSDNGIGSRKVVEDARFWMPADARYRVVLGRHPSTDWQFAPVLIASYLLPRRQVSHGPAEWAFCFRCDRSRLGGRFVVLSRAANGVSFGRVVVR